MCSVLMSIKPKYVKSILSGEKVFEFRKKACKKTIDRIYIYSTVPVQKVVGEAKVESILIKSPAELWKLTHAGAGIDKDFFDKYFENRKEAVAYKLSNVKKYNKPITLSEFGIKAAPQSYQYIDSVIYGDI